MTRFIGPALLVPLLVMGCSTTPTVRFTAPIANVEARVNIPYEAIELREVTLPVYAAAEEISVLAATGEITAAASNLWADDPTRAITLQLAKALGDITRETVASEPWPFENAPDARVEVRISEMLADANGTYRAEGQYFVANGLGRPDRAKSFSITTQYDVTAGVGALAAARSALVVQLAELIARKGLR